MEEALTLRKARAEDSKQVIAMYGHASKILAGLGIDQWDELYPTPGLLRADIEKGEMFVAILTGSIAASVVTNKEFDDAYNAAQWREKSGKFAVVHRLCVNPDFHNIGIGTAAMRKIEPILQKEGAASIRLDAFSKNPYAIKLYEKLGYQITGTANWRKGLFYLYEKILVQ